MKNFSLQFVIALIVLTVSYPALAAVAGRECNITLACENMLTGEDLTFANCNARLSVLQVRLNTKASHVLIPDIQMKMLLHDTLPALRAIAQESGNSVSGLLEEYLALTTLLREQNSSASPEILERERVISLKLLEAVKKLDELDPKQKLKRKHWDLVRSLASTLTVLSGTAYMMESAYLERPTFDGSAMRFDRSLIETVFNSLEASGLERAIQLVEKRKNDAAAKEEMKAAKKSALEWAPPHLNTVPALKIELPQSLPTQLKAPKSAQLVTTVQSQQPLFTSTVYEVTTAYHLDLHVQLSEEIVEESEGPNRPVVLQLLRSIATGHGHTLGIKTLFDLGPGIVELKARNHGHKRILGCLDGANLTLKKFAVMPSTRAGYAKRIPHNFCE